MKMKIYLKYLMAPLSMLVILACSPDQYQMQGEYDDVYFTKNDRKGQPQIVAQNQQALAQQLNEQSGAQAAVPLALQEKYSNGEDPVYYYEEQGPRVHSPRELNYDDFLYDYDNEHLAYYELPLDWDTDWSRNAFNNMMNQDFQFRMAWYEQYYEGDDWRMRQYLSGNSSLAARNRTAGLPQVGINAGFNSFGPGMYPGGMMAVDMNPYGFYDPFWRPINRFGFSSGLGFGWSNPYYCPPYAPIYTGGTISTGTPGTIGSSGDIIAGNQQIVRGGRYNGTTISSVQVDSQNGAQIRTRSQRITQVGSGSGSGSYAGVQGTTGGRVISGRGSARPDGAGRMTRADLTVGNLKRVSTDTYRSNQGDRITRTARYNRVDASQISSGRSANGSSRVGRNTGFTRAAIERVSGDRTGRGGSYGNLSFDRRSSSSMSRSVIERGNGSSGRSAFGRSSYSRSSGSPSYSRGSSGRSSSGSFSRGSSSGRSSGGVSRSSSSGSSGGSSGGRSSSSGVSRSGRN